MANDNEFILITDSTCDLPQKILDENGIHCLVLGYNIDGIEYGASKPLAFEDFYAKLRNGSMVTTSQVTPDKYEQVFLKYISKGMPVLYIAFSSGLSGSYNSALIAKNAVIERYPDAKLIIIDSLCASLGEGLLVYKAIELKNQGKSIDEVAEWVEQNKLHLCHMFTVDNLMFLHRGGRVSRTSAIAGSILGIKPGLHVDNEGHLIPLTKIRGRKQSIKWLVDEMEKRVGNWENDTFAICHGDCLEDAKYLEQLVKDRFGIKKAIIRHTGNVIGSHSGPGTLALFFLGDYR